MIQFDRGDALVTRINDRPRDRHAKEDNFHIYDHYLSFYWIHRTAGIEIVDTVAKGGTTVRMNVTSQFKLHPLQAENRWFYMGLTTVAQYCNNGVMNVIDETHYWKEASTNCLFNFRPLQIGDKIEFEVSQFLDPSLPEGRTNYYGTVFLYIVGKGIVPWDVGGTTPAGGIKDSVPLPDSALLGGSTTIHAMSSNEPYNRFMQMPTNLGFDNGQPFVSGRRVFHSSFVDGTHDERPTENPVFPDVVGKAGPHFVNHSCASCHVRDGGAAPNPIGVPLDRWVFKVGDANGNPHPTLGRVLQPSVSGGATSEGSVSIASYTATGSLQRPNFQFTGTVPTTFSARITPRLVGMGLLEAIPESAILANENPTGTGISGRANRVTDPSGIVRLGRFGWKAGTTSVRHQVAAALNTDIGVNTSVLPNPDCGSSESGCGASGSELSDANLADLVKYVSLLGVPPQRNYNDTGVANGKTTFTNIGCSGCHTPTFTTSQYAPLAELRSQTIHPYTDLLLHDMGSGLADTLGEGLASGAEWRTAPLWGMGLAPCVLGSTATEDPTPPAGCFNPVVSYLHDGRARSVDEAIMWHGGEGLAAKNAYSALSSTQKADLLSFLNSL